MSRRNNENTPKNKLASNASSQGRRNNRKFQTTIKKKHKFSTFSARDFKEAKKHFNMNKDSNNTSNSSSISNNNGKYTTPSMSRRVGGCRSGNRRSNNNNAWTTAKVNNRNNNINNLASTTSSDNVKVFVRLRPTDDDAKTTDDANEAESGFDHDDSLDAEDIANLQEKNIASVTKRSVTLGSRSETSKCFTYDNVFSHDSRQLDIFEEVGKPVVDAAIKGYNGSVFAYGQTGSGKTYTMLGTPENPGLIPRVIQHLFSKLNANQEENNNSVDAAKVKHVIRVSYLEIYNERVLDLLDVEAGTKQLRENIKRGVYVDKLLEKKVNTPDEAAEWMAVGNNNRKTASTAMNSQSSRSHAVFTLTVEMSMINKNTGVRLTRYSRVNLIDLAGSERQRDTLVTGARLKEASTINKSLSTLGNVIMSLVDIANTGTARHVHYRDSKLTFLLRDSLGGNTRTSMIATISPKEKNYAESLSTLKFAQRAKYIRNKVTANEDAAGTADSLRKEIKRLKERINKMSLSTSSKAADESKTKISEQTILKLKGLLLKQDKVWTAKMKNLEEKLKLAYEQANASEDKLESFKLRHAMSNRRESSARDSSGRFSPLSGIIEEEAENATTTEADVIKTIEEEEEEETAMQKTDNEINPTKSKTAWRQSIDNLRRESQDSIENTIEDHSLRIQVHELSEENSRLKSTLHCSQDEKETMQDTINELKLKTESLTAKLKSYINTNLTPQKKLLMKKQNIATPENVRKMKEEYKQVKYDREIMKNKLSQVQRDLNSASSAAITLQKELSTKRSVLNEMESVSSEMASELKDVKSQLEEAKKQIANKNKLKDECKELKEKIKLLEQQRNINTASFMNLSTTAGAALNRFGLGVAGFAASQNKKQQQQDLEPSTANVVQQGIINTLEKALAKSKLEVKTLKNNNSTNNDEIVSDEEDDEDENEFDEEDTDENMANNNMQLGINNKIKKQYQRNSIHSHRNSSIGSDVSTSSNVQVYKYTSPQKTIQTNTTGARFSVAKYFPGGEKFKSVKRRSSSVYSDDFGGSISDKSSAVDTVHEDDEM